MPKKKLVKIAEEQEVEFEEAMRIALEKLPDGSLTGKGKNIYDRRNYTQALFRYSSVRMP